MDLIKSFGYGLVVAFACHIQANAQPVLRVSSIAWDGLASAEKSIIQHRYLVEKISPESFGLIVDNQGIDKSIGGTTAGSSLGEAVGSSIYIDKALNSGNYSAKGHLGAILLGGILGSSLDRKPSTSFHFRYAIKLGNGNVAFQDVYSSEPFRQPAGICVRFPEITPLPEQHVCAQTTDSLRDAHINKSARTAATPQSLENMAGDKTSEIKADTTMVSEKLVNCKPNMLAAIRATAEKCRQINGAVIDD